ncbi:MAG: type II toxin-antitoxin system RelE/ParE family toxin [bacterium]|nr:type II toxin-antitoxin system RelE/ParE family toxin [bacterium]
MIVRFHPEAELDLQDVMQWYGNKRFGLDAEFMLCIDEALSRITRNPNLYPVELRDVRKVLVRRFPYVIYYITNAESIVILAVFHVKRNPIQWKLRIETN